MSEQAKSGEQAKAGSSGPGPGASPAPKAAAGGAGATGQQKPAARPAPRSEGASPGAPRPSVGWAGIATGGFLDLPASASHQVRDGDSFESLAREYYGDRRLAGKIRDANPKAELRGDRPLPGQQLVIPKH